MASDGCNQIGKSFGPITTSFAPGELSTIDLSGGTKVYNFSELPCPPSGVDLLPGQTYAPLIAPPLFIFDLDPAFSTCIPAYNYSQGLIPPIDPPTALPTVHSGLQGPGVPGGDAPPRRDLGARARPLAFPQGPAKTAEPKHEVQL